MKKAIITGANGFIGRHLVKELLAQKFEVWAVVRSIRASEVLCKNVNIVYCDMDDVERLPELIKNDVSGAYFYCLAWEGSDGVKREDYEMQLRNALRTANAVKAAKKLNCSKFIVSGSVTQLVYRNYLMENNAKPEMVACYAVGKITAEALVKCLCNDLKLDFCWTYISNFYGEDDTTNNFINFIIDKYLKNEMPILTPGQQLVDFMHVDDVARALRYIAEKDLQDNSYYIGYGNPKPLKEFIMNIYERISPNCSSGIGKKEFAGKSIDYEVINYKRFSEETGFIPNIEFKDGIQRVIVARCR